MPAVRPSTALGTQEKMAAHGAIVSQYTTHSTCEISAVSDDGDEGGALSSGPEVNVFSFKQLGYILQYFSVGLIYGGLPATSYGLFQGYLNVPAHVFATAKIVLVMPWAFKFAFGLINDVFPIVGYRRKPYMVLGWSFCSLMLLLLWQTPLPAPYWCLSNTTGEALTDAKPCNAAAQQQGGRYALMMMAAALGYVIADVAADGLTVEFARREPIKKRGRTQTTAYMVRTIGVICATLLVGFGMNGKEYNGSFDFGLSFNTICAILALPSTAMVPISWFLIDEPRSSVIRTCREYLSMSWALLSSRAMLFVLCFQFFSAMISQITTPAIGPIKRYWAGVQVLQSSLFAIVGHVLFVIGLALVKKYFLSMDWRCMLMISLVSLQLLDMPFQFLTVFGVVRNQYFYLGETFLLEIPDAINFVVSTFVIVEMAENGNEGLVYGLLTTTYNLGQPLGRAISNQLYTIFRPSLDESSNYIQDTVAFRSTVAKSFILSYAFAFSSLFMLILLPSQKAEAQRRKRVWAHHNNYAVASVMLIGSALVYSLMVNMLSMFPETMCLKFAGGGGCDVVEEAEE
ncbi:hypothetical protein AB1Y20_008967 [Prymnesium parvum]|uniref:Transmembrane protein n=1 Tax=Prymnesium parvum TaxID=97485 RepID=A0AB34K099_PRYPA